MIYEYNVTVPLTYNRTEVGTNHPDSEVRFGMKQPAEAEFSAQVRDADASLDYTANENMKIQLWQQDLCGPAGSPGLRGSEPDWICRIDGLLAGSEIQARERTEEIVDRLCKRLSLVFAGHNANRHLFQPRVEPIWSKARYQEREYPPAVEAKREALDRTGVAASDGVVLRDGVYLTVSTDIDRDEIDISEWLSTERDDFEFLLTEYYSALGQENIRSKFFHLFTIIEYCEQKYAEHNGAEKILTDREADRIVGEIMNQVNGVVPDGEHRNKLRSAAANCLKRATDIGREKKLLNILEWMGITAVQQGADSVVLDAAILKRLTDLRNRSYHAGAKDTEEENAAYAQSVVILLSICEGILGFLMK